MLHGTLNTVNEKGFTRNAAPFFFTGDFSCTGTIACGESKLFIIDLSTAEMTCIVAGSLEGFAPSIIVSIETAFEEAFTILTITSPLVLSITELA